jgi:hypothetical protein
LGILWLINEAINICQALVDGIKIGASVSCNGGCLTVVETSGDTASFDLIVETLRATNLGELVPGSIVNFERHGPLVPVPPQPDCLLIVYQCASTPAPGHSFRR